MKLSIALALATMLAQAPEPKRATHETLSAPQAPSMSDAQAPAPTPASDAKPAVQLEPWHGTIAEGLAEVRKRSEANDPDAARALADRLLAPNAWLKWKEDLASQPGWKASIARASEPVLDFLGLEALEPSVRAEVAFARGVVEHVAGEEPAARAAFDRARADAGPGELRLASGFQLGTSWLLEGERWREQIPEIQQSKAGANGAPPTPAPQPPAGPGAANVPGQPPPPDPLKEARTAYLAARDRFVDRLRADWTDASVRANTELVQRRLKELDAIEQKRKEEEQKKQQQQQDENDPNKDPNQQKKDPKDSKNDSKDKQDKQDKQDQPKPDEPKQDEKKPDEPKPEDQPKQEDDKPPQEEPSQAEQRELSKEEMTRLLDLLKQREQQWKKLQKELQHARRGKVKKDW